MNEQMVQLLEQLVARVERLEQALVQSEARAATLNQRLADNPPPDFALNGPTDLNPEVLVAITAGLSAALAGRPFQMRRIRLAPGNSPMWSQLGRQSIMTSHAIERKMK